MTNFLEQHCPNCKKQDELHVTFTGTARLTRDGTEDVGDHEYSDTADVHCEDCDWRGMMRDLIDDTYEAPANARLIAAAPELLEACWEAINALDLAARFCPDDAQDGRAISIRAQVIHEREMIMAAIRKAESADA